jgi:hypothetical protein
MSQVRGRWRPSIIDWFSLLDPINSMFIGTRHDDVRSSQADVDVVLGLAGNDYLNSSFNRTALIGGCGNDTLTTKLLSHSSAPLHGLAIQIGGTGSTPSLRLRFNNRRLLEPIGNIGRSRATLLRHAGTTGYGGIT